MIVNMSRKHRAIPLARVNDEGVLGGKDGRDVYPCRRVPIAVAPTRVRSKHMLPALRIKGNKEVPLPTHFPTDLLTSRIDARFSC